MARRVEGRVVVPDLDGLGAAVVGDYLRAPDGAADSAGDDRDGRRRGRSKPTFAAPITAGEMPYPGSGCAPIRCGSTEVTNGHTVTTTSGPVTTIRRPLLTRHHRLAMAWSPAGWDQLPGLLGRLIVSTVALSFT